MVEAIFNGGLDASYVGPNPAINAWAQSEGTAIKIVSGATSGGAFLVVSPDITGPDQLAGTTLGSPQLGNTQDVALRAWLKDQGRPFALEAAMAKLYTGELSQRVANYALQIHGGYGYMEESAISRLYRDQKILEIGEGTNEVQRMVIARHLGL